MWFEYSFSLVENIFWGKSHRPKWLYQNSRASYTFVAMEIAEG